MSVERIHRFLSQVFDRECRPVSYETCDADVRETTERRCFNVTKNVVEESCRWASVLILLNAITKTFEQNRFL
jgi:hypothetical protein